MNQVKILLALAAAALAAGCAPPDSEPRQESTPVVPKSPETPIVSLLGEPLAAPELGEEFRARQQELLAEAREAWEAAPDDPETWIWVGRRTAYLSRYGEAIDIYSRAIDRFPDEPRLYRHRGHRYLTSRKLDAAIDDLSHAAVLIAGEPDRVEPDGLPNERGIPTSTLQSNIWYHLGLAHYLQGDFESAVSAYRECLTVSKNPDMLVATAYWLYLTERRLGNTDAAAELLETITPEMDVIENQDYHQLLLSYRRLVNAHALWREAGLDPAAVRFATVAYGIGAWHLVEGREEKATEWFERAHESSSWAAFGYLAAEAELARRPS